MELSKLEELLKRKNQRFICSPAGGPSGGDTSFTAHIEHEVSPPLASEQIRELEEQFGYHEQLIKLLSTHGSVRLYCDTLSDDSAGGIGVPSHSIKSRYLTYFP